jgi:chemotaxis protein histidine kinase CheA
LTEILQTIDFGQKTLLEVFKYHLSAKILENVEDYLDLLFNSDIDEETLFDLNPLSHIEMTFRKENELLSTDKVLAFKFKRIYINEKISGLIATVTDITEQVRLAKKLEESEEQSNQQMEWFLSILHVEPKLLKEFIDSAHRELNEIENILKTNEPGEKFQDVLEKIYRSVHLIKGNASLLDLKFYAKKAHDFEEEIEGLQKQEKLSAKDFIPLVMHLGEMRSDMDEINKMIERISQIHAHFRPKRSFESKMLVRSIDNLVNTISKDYKKEVRFIHSKFNGEQIPYEYRLAVKDILIQMVRNSLKHGIELPDEREQNGKPRSGSIEISSFLNNGEFCFRFRDDGRGLQIDKLKEKIKSSGKWSDSEIEKWDDKRIAQSIFKSGISTSDSTDLVAGRGVGMDIIHQKIKSHKGQITFDYEEGRFLEFSVSLPRTDTDKVKEKK